MFSALAWNLSYRFPVHQISPEFQPREPAEEPTHLVVYRDRDERVRFLEINAVTQRLIQLLKENSEWRGLDAVSQIARELMKFVANGLLYRGSKPVMLSVVRIVNATRPWYERGTSATPS